MKIWRYKNKYFYFRVVKGVLSVFIVDGLSDREKREAYIWIGKSPFKKGEV